MNALEKQLLQTPAFRGAAELLSNFSLYRPEEYMIQEGITYKSSEHYYQAMKFRSLCRRTEVANHELRGLKNFVRKAVKEEQDYAWDAYFTEYKEEMMLQALRHKFSQPRYAEMLESTGTLELVERNNWNDVYWGVCRGIGANRLGILLMQIRDENRQK